MEQLNKTLKVVFVCLLLSLTACEDNPENLNDPIDLVEQTQIFLSDLDNDYKGDYIWGWSMRDNNSIIYGLNLEVQILDLSGTITARIIAYNSDDSINIVCDKQLTNEDQFVIQFEELTFTSFNNKVHIDMDALDETVDGCASVHIKAKGI